MNKIDLSIFEEIKEKYELDCSLKDLLYDFCSGYIIQKRKIIDKIKSEYSYEHLAQKGGGEGGSEYCYGVFKLKDKIYKAEYRYYSYEGYSYDYILETLKEVKPVEKTIIVYEYR